MLRVRYVCLQPPVPCSPPDPPGKKKTSPGISGSGDSSSSSSSKAVTSQAAIAEGEYEEHYDTRNSIGKGAFGFVKLATRKADGREVQF